MRLIDADKLKTDMVEKVYCGDGTYKVFGVSRKQIDAAPTISLRPNDPLTLEEMRGMDGEPIWVDTEGEDYAPCWMLLKYHAGRAFFSECFSVGLNDYGKTWLAYRHRPVAHGRWLPVDEKRTLLIVLSVMRWYRRSTIFAQNVVQKWT